MALANKPLNLQAIALEETETKIRETVKREYLSGSSKRDIDNKVFALIAAALKAIKLPTLRDLAKRSLLNFYMRQYTELKRSLNANIALYAAIMLLLGQTPGKEEKPTRAQTAQARATLLKSDEIPEDLKYEYRNTRILGAPLKKYMQDYINDNVRPVVERLAKQYPQDPHDSAATHRNSLRNLAEMEVRWQAHVSEIDGLKARGVKLAIVSAHADCSKRCAGAQGKVVSLDGTSGVTDDGRPYRPLEEYTDVFVRTKAGKVYKNGLFGFNCRHYLVAYRSGYKFPKPDVARERREYAITERQRQLETAVRKLRTRAIEFKGTGVIHKKAVLDKKTGKWGRITEYEYYRRKAAEANKRYIEFSRAHNRAYFPSRTKLV